MSDATHEQKIIASRQLAAIMAGVADADRLNRQNAAWQATGLDL